MEVLADSEEMDKNDYSEEDNEVEEDQKHDQLLQSLSSLSRKNKNRETLRTEASTIVSDFHMSEGTGKVKIHELLKGLNTSKFSVSKKQLKSAARKTKLLQVPLPKPQAERIKRHVAYEKTSKEISKWDSIVNKNRTAECLEFPLNNPGIRLEPVTKFVKRFEAKTPLEMEVANILSGSDSVHTEDQLLTPAEERAMKAMSLEEARERLQELQKMRALLSYQEARARRQNKIKSKRYHRILKKDRLKKQLAEFEALKTDNPEEALEKLQDIDRRRIEERLTLKHKNTGKWAKQNAIRSKYDKQARDALSEQLQLSKQLTQKAVQVSSDEESEDEPMISKQQEEEEEEEGKNQDNQTPSLPVNYNAWLKDSTSTSVNLRTEPAVTQNHNPKVVRIKTKQKNNVTFKRAETVKIASQESVSESTTDIPDEPEILSETFHHNPPDEVTPDVTDIEPKDHMPINESAAEKKAKEVLVDPSKFIGAKPKVLLSTAPVLMESDDEGLNNSQAQLTMREAFADDDVLEEFQKAKESAVEDGKPKDIDLFLPGWGDWGGSGIVPSKRKRRRFLVKAPPAAPRKDQNLGNVIINEEKETHISRHMVSELPFPFKNVQQFETSVGHPVGSTWNTQLSFQDLIRPEVIVRKGKIIEPMTVDEILKKKTRKLISKKKKENGKLKIDS